jgi:hypothetical protein
VPASGSTIRTVASYVEVVEGRARSGQGGDIGAGGIGFDVARL